MVEKRWNKITVLEIWLRFMDNIFYYEEEQSLEKLYILWRLNSMWSVLGVWPSNRQLKIFHNLMQHIYYFSHQKLRNFENNLVNLSLKINVAFAFVINDNIRLLSITMV